MPCVKACKHKLFFPSTVFLLPVLKKKINQIAELRKVFVYCLDLELVEI